MWSLLEPRRIGAALLIAGLAVTGMACDLASSQQARDVLEAGREARRIEREEIEPRLAVLDQLRAEEIEPREFEISQLYDQMSDIEHQKIDPIHEQLRQLERPKSPPDLMPEIDQAMREIFEEERALETDMRALSTGFQEQEQAVRSALEASARAKEDLAYELGRQLRDLHRSGRAPIEAIFQEIRSLEQQLGSLAPDSPEARDIRQRIESLHGSVSGMEAEFASRVRSLEDQMNAASDEARLLYRQIETESRGLRESFEEGMRAIEARRTALNERRFQLEDEGRERLMSMGNDVQDRHAALEAQIEAVVTGEIVPLRERVRSLSAELRELRARERALTNELREVREQLRPVEGQMEDTLLDLLERAIQSAPVAEATTTSAP